MNSGPPRTDVLGSRLSNCDMESALASLALGLQTGEGGYVCLTNVHAVVTGRLDPSFREITNAAYLSLPDGRPVYWTLLAKRRPRVGHVPGPELFIEALRRFPGEGHFFYGSTQAVLDKLVAMTQTLDPPPRICGMLSPPFRELTPADDQEHWRIIRDSGARFVWVSLGAPKQERWMARSQDALRPAILLGVGAAFDFHSGRIQRAPAWMKRLGLEWLHRVAHEPRRLWKRYLVTNTLFIWYLGQDAIRGIFGTARDRADTTP